MFRRRIRAAYAIAFGLASAATLDRAGVLRISSALSAMSVDESEALAIEPWIRCLIFDVWYSVPGLEQEVESTLGASWAGNVLKAMKAHHAEQLRRRAKHDELNSPEAIQRRREAKKMANLERHLARIARKSSRDHATKDSHSQGQ